MVSIVPLPPFAANDTVCYGANNVGLTGTGSNIKWYSDMGLTNLLHTGNIYEPTVINSGTYSYYITQSDINCESEPFEVRYVILPAVLSPEVISDAICYGDLTPEFISQGNGDIHWYSDALLTNLLHTGDTFASNEVSAGIYTYYVTLFDTVYSCESVSDTFSLEIVALAEAVAGVDTSICKNSVAHLHVAAFPNSTYTWSSGGTSIQEDVYPLADTKYYVSVDNGCSIAVDSVMVSIVPLPPSGVNDTVCHGALNPPLVASGNNINWYNDSILSTVIHTGQQYTPLDTAVGTYSYWITQTEGVCESSAVEVIFDVLESPQTPVVNNQTVCYGFPVLPFVANGNGVINWYSDLLLTNLIATGDTLISNETDIGIYKYYVNILDTNNNCLSETKTVTLIIMSAPYSEINNDTTICSGDFAGLYVETATTATFLWSTGATTQDISVNPIQTTQYYVTIQNACGIAIDSTVVYVNPLPNAFAGSDTSICKGDSVTLYAIGGAYYLWNIGYDNDSIVVSPAVSTNYIVTVTDINSCSNSDDVNVEVYPLPQINTSGDSLICEGYFTTLIASGGSSYLWNTGDTMSEIHVNPHINQNYTVTVSNIYGCEGTSQLSVSVSPAPVITISGDFDIEKPVLIGQLLTFTALPDIYDLYNFYINNNLEQSSLSNTFVSNLLNNTDIVTVIAYENECPSLTDSIIIKVKEVPNAFTPFNKDGKNDIFAEGTDLTILNIWGQLLYRGTEGWNGEYKGQRVNPGTYYYIITINTGTQYSKIFTGSVVVSDR